MITPNRHERRRRDTLQARGFSDKEIRKEPHALEARAASGIPPSAMGDPLLNSTDVRRHCGNVSVMTLHRWRGALGFPSPDLVLLRKNYWRLSSLERWLAEQASAA
jgi:hypothetical protein